VAISVTPSLANIVKEYPEILLNTAVVPLGTAVLFGKVIVKPFAAVVTLLISATTGPFGKEVGHDNTISPVRVIN
jgi:hypothetical protein